MSTDYDAQQQFTMTVLTQYFRDSNHANEPIQIGGGGGSPTIPIQRGANLNLGLNKGD